LFANTSDSRAVQLNTAMSKVYGYMSFGLLVTALVAFITSQSPAMMAAIFGTPLKWVVLLSPLVFILIMSFALEKLSRTALQLLFVAFSTVMGLSMSTLPHIYTGLSLFSTFLLTGGLFGAMSFYGYFTKKDLTSWGQLLFWALIGIIIAMVVNIFLGSSMLSTIISMVAVVVFLGLTAYDTQKIREMMWDGDSDGKVAIMGAVTLYLDFINLFIHLLNLIGVKKD